MRKISLFIAAFLLSAVFADAQRWSVSTNLVEWANLGTANIEAGAAVHRHLTLHAGVRYNPWTFRPGDPDDRLSDPEGDTEDQFENRKRAVSLSLRYWPWHVYSGWWGYVRGQAMEYNRGGVFHHEAREGDAYGLGVGAGYTRMLHKHWNIELGAGIWGGWRDETVYRCTNCGTVNSRSKGAFILPDDVFVSLIYIF